LDIYANKPNIYLEETITLKNNLAIANENFKNYTEAIRLYNQVLELEDKFYSISDERRISTLNNLFCLYYEQGNKK